MYKVTDGKRGRAIIISNEYFTDASLASRCGNSTDVQNLKELFELLHFTVETVTDRTAEVLFNFTSALHVLSM